jgi:riboflavin synthase
MFTGIIDHSGTIESLSIYGQGGRLTIQASGLAEPLAVSNSIAVNGCCLTVLSLDNDHFTADLSGETIRRTSFGAGAQGLKVGTRVNLERPLTAGKEFGGHFVLGHVDGVGAVKHLRPEGENWWYGVKVPEDFARYIVPKGSITIDGISLTVARWADNIAEIAIIPYTFDHTNLRDLKPGDAVNLEGDVLGKYIERHLQTRIAAPEPRSALTLSQLRYAGF